MVRQGLSPRSPPSACVRLPECRGDARSYRLVVPPGAAGGAFEKDTERLTRRVRNGRHREVNAAPKLPDPLAAEGAR